MKTPKSPAKAAPTPPVKNPASREADAVSPLGKYAKAGQIAAQFGLHPKTIHRWAARGLIHERKLNQRLVLFDVAEVIAFVESARVA